MRQSSRSFASSPLWHSCRRSLGGGALPDLRVVERAELAEVSAASGKHGVQEVDDECGDADAATADGEAAGADAAARGRRLPDRDRALLRGESACPLICPASGVAEPQALRQRPNTRPPRVKPSPNVPTAKAPIVAALRARGERLPAAERLFLFHRQRLAAALLAQRSACPQTEVEVVEDLGRLVRHRHECTPRFGSIQHGSSTSRTSISGARTRPRSSARSRR